MPYDDNISSTYNSMATRCILLASADIIGDVSRSVDKNS